MNSQLQHKWNAERDRIRRAIRPEEKDPNLEIPFNNARLKQHRPKDDAR